MHDSQDTRVRASPSCSSFIHVISPTLLTISVHFLTFPTLILLILPFCPYIHYIYLEQQLQSQFVGCCRQLTTTTTTKYNPQPFIVSQVHNLYCIIGNTLEVSSKTFQIISSYFLCKTLLSLHERRRIYLIQLVSMEI